MCRRLDEVFVARVGWSAGTKRPEPRKVLMLEMRRREEAEGERRMMGSIRERVVRGFWGIGTEGFRADGRGAPFVGAG